MDANTGVGGGRPVAQQRGGTGPVSGRQPLFVASIGLETEPSEHKSMRHGNRVSAYAATLYTHYICQIAAFSLRTRRP